MRAVPREWCVATWSGKERCSERELRESLATGDHPENWRATNPRIGWDVNPGELEAPIPECDLGCHPRGIGRYQFPNVIRQTGLDLA